MGRCIILLTIGAMFQNLGVMVGVVFVGVEWVNPKPLKAVVGYDGDVFTSVVIHVCVWWDELYSECGGNYIGFHV